MSKVLLRAVPPFFILILLCVISSLLAPASKASPAGPAPRPGKSDSNNPSTESYLSRPDILDDTQVPAKPHPELPKPWDLLKPAHVEAIAEILEMYPTEEIYFLARDAELLYDLAKLATRDEPEQIKRIHLLNVSRANMKDPNLKYYLEQEGISPLTLSAGKQVLFVDTGFAGTIPSVIDEIFPYRLQTHLKTHLLCSSKTKYPSTRVFLQWLNPVAVLSDPAVFRGTIYSYESLPRYTDRSFRFEERSQEGKTSKWEPMSRLHFVSDGMVSRESARAYMEDLKNYAESGEARSLMKNQRARWHHLMALVKGNSPTQEVTAALKSLLSDQDPHSEAIVRDFLEVIYRNHSDVMNTVALNLDELGLRPLVTGQNRNKLTLIKRYPQWKSILENPRSGVQALVESGDFQTLRSMLDVIVDYEVTSLAIQELSKEKYFKNPESLKEIRGTIEGIIEQGNIAYVREVGRRIFLSPQSTLWTREFKKELQLVVSKLEPIDKGMSIELQSNHDYPFGDPPHAIGNPKIIYRRVTPQQRAELVSKHGPSFEKAWINPRGLIVGDLIRDKNGAIAILNWAAGKEACESVHARLLTDEEQLTMGEDMKDHSKGVYIPQFLPNLSLGFPFYNCEWSRDLFRKDIGRCFDGKTGLLHAEDPRAARGQARCAVEATL